jgi:hypothetical protein
VKKSPLNNNNLYYEESYMLENIMNTETAKDLGYVRVIKFQNLEFLLDINAAILNHATAELKSYNPNLFLSKSILLGNFSFLMRILIYHVLLVSLCNNPYLQIFMLIITEASYSTLILKNFLKLSYLTNKHLFFSKIS